MKILNTIKSTLGVQLRNQFNFLNVLERMNTRFQFKVSDNQTEPPKNKIHLLLYISNIEFIYFFGINDNLIFNLYSY